MAETLEVPRTEWFRRLSPKAEHIYLMWLPGGGKIAYFEETDEFYWWGVDGGVRTDLVRLTEERNRWLTFRLRRELLASAR